LGREALGARGKVNKQTFKKRNNREEMDTTTDEEERHQKVDEQVASATTGGNDESETTLAFIQESKEVKSGDLYSWIFSIPHLNDRF
jgi:hypothetical protein